MIVLEGCCTPRGCVLEQLTPQAMERVFIRSYYLRSKMESCLGHLPVCIYDRYELQMCTHVIMQVSAGHVCINVSQSVYIGAFVLACVSMCRFCFFLRTKRGQRWDCPATLQPLPAHFDTPRRAGFCPAHQPSWKATLPYWGRQKIPDGLNCFLAPFSPLCRGGVPGSWDQVLDTFCIPLAQRHHCPRLGAQHHFPSEAALREAGTLA